MAQIGTTYQYEVNLDKGAREVTLHSPLMQMDALADEFRASVRRGDAPVDVSGMTAYGYLYIASRNATLPLRGTVSGNIVSVVLTSDCYACPGYASLVIQLHDGQVRHTVLKVNLCIMLTGNDRVINSGDILPSLAELLAQIDAMERAAAGANAAADAANQARDGIQGELGTIRDSLLQYNACNLTRMFGTYEDGTHLGVHFAWDDRKESCVLNGTSTGTAFNRFLMQKTSLYPFEKGKRYLFDVSTTNMNASAHLYWYYGGVIDAANPVYITKKTSITVPDDAGGLMLRIGTAPNVTFSNDVVTFSVRKAPSNEELADELDALRGDTLHPDGTRDRSGEIRNTLAAYGHCRFAEGDYYLSDAITLEEGQSITGAGKGTRFLKPSDATKNGFFLVKGTAHNVTFRDFTIVGSNATKPSAEVLVGQYGIYVSDNAGYVTIDNVGFTGLTRAGVIVGSGYSWLRSVSVSSCSFLFCGKGIELMTGGEFANVTGCCFNSCYFGVTNAGGNNKFSACGFDACTVGFLLYDADGTGNNGHGTATGCTFNHCSEAGIKAVNCTKGYVFSGCQIYYGGVSCSGSRGLIFADCQLRGGDGTRLVFDSCGLALFDACVFVENPVFVLSGSPRVQRTNCYLRDSGELI